VAIIGGGPVGLCATITAQLYSPTNLIMITRDKNRLKIAKSLGATHCIPFGPNSVKEVMELTNGRGVDTVIEAAGVPATFDLCQELVGIGGTIANVGVHGCKVDLHLDKLWHKNISAYFLFVQPPCSSNFGQLLLLAWSIPSPRACF
jgi:alcohol dehydrogenase